MKSGGEVLHELEEGDRLERLIDQHRVPSGFMLGMPGTPSFCYLPPEGTQPGDILTEDPEDTLPFDARLVVMSPKGVVRGPAEMVAMTTEQTIRIRERIRNYLQPEEVLGKASQILDSQDRPSVKFPMISNSKPMGFISKILQRLQR